MDTFYVRLDRRQDNGLLNGPALYVPLVRADDTRIRVYRLNYQTGAMEPVTGTFAHDFDDLMFVSFVDKNGNHYPSTTVRDLRSGRIQRMFFNVQTVEYASNEDGKILPWPGMDSLDNAVALLSN